jgi:hypothetical protein
MMLAMGSDGKEEGPKIKGLRWLGLGLQCVTLQNNGMGFGNVDYGQWRVGTQGASIIRMISDGDHTGYQD